MIKIHDPRFLGPHAGLRFSRERLLVGSGFSALGVQANAADGQLWPVLNGTDVTVGQGMTIHNEVLAVSAGWPTFSGCWFLEADIQAFSAPQAVMGVGVNPEWIVGESYGSRWSNGSFQSSVGVQFDSPLYWSVIYGTSSLYATMLVWNPDFEDMNQPGNGPNGGTVTGTVAVVPRLLFTGSGRRLGILGVIEDGALRLYGMYWDAIRGWLAVGVSTMEWGSWLGTLQTRASGLGFELNATSLHPLFAFGDGSSGAAPAYIGNITLHTS